MKRPWLKVLPWLLLGVLLVYVWAFEPFDWHAAWTQVQALPPMLWAQLLAVFVLSYAPRIGRWVDTVQRSKHAGQADDFWPFAHDRHDVEFSHLFFKK